MTIQVSVGNDELRGRDGDSRFPSISADGQFVAFTSEASNLAPDDTNRAGDVFVRDLARGITTRESVSSREVQGNRRSESSTSLSADGRFVAFNSLASNLVRGDTNRSLDVFVRDRVNGTTRRVSVSSLGRQGNSGSQNAAISADGRFVAFNSDASNLVRGDTNNSKDVFVRNLATGTTRRVSVSSREIQGTAYSFWPAISAHGRYVVFPSFASNLVRSDTNRDSDVFVRDRAAGTTRRVSVSSDETEAPGFSGGVPAISPHGRYVAFSSSAPNLVAGDTHRNLDVFVRDRTAGTTTRVSVNSDERRIRGSNHAPAISGRGGRYVAFNVGGANEVFVRDRVTGTTRPVSMDYTGALTGGASADDSPAISKSGHRVAFWSYTPLVPGDTDGGDVFLRVTAP